MDWVVDHWYVVWGGFCALMVLIGHLVFRRDRSSRAARVFYALFSNLDPSPEAVAERNAQALRGLIVAGIGLVIVGFFLLAVWLFSKIDVVS